MFNKKYISLEELKSMEIKQGKLIALSFSSGGGHLGTFHLLTIIFSINQLITVDRENNNSKTIDRKYSISNDDINEIKELIEDYNLPAWKNLPPDISSMKTDVPNNYFSIAYDNNDYTFQYHTLLMTEEEKEIFKNFKDYIYSLIKEENLIEQNEKMIVDDEE